MFPLHSESRRRLPQAPTVWGSGLKVDGSGLLVSGLAFLKVNASGFSVQRVGAKEAQSARFDCLMCHIHSTARRGEAVHPRDHPSPHTPSILNEDRRSSDASRMNRQVPCVKRKLFSVYMVYGLGLRYEVAALGLEG